MKVRLAYGKKGLEIQLPDQASVDVIEPSFVSGIPDQEGAIASSLIHPINSKPLRKIAGKNDRTAIIFSDVTRATPYHVILPPLLEALRHLPDRQITFFCATGTHRPAPEDELVGILGREVVKRFRIVQNQTTDKSLFRKIGTSSLDNEIWLNSELLDNDLIILTGFIEPHFFAGFSGGGKAMMPGMAWEGTIRNNHSIARLSSEQARWGITAGNPMWEEVMEAAEMVSNKLFLLNITLNSNQEITGVFAGDLRKAHKKACEFAKVSAMAGVKEAYDIVITTNSGYPLDLNVYQSVKGMSAAAQVVRQGGTIIAAAECWDGIPSGGDYEKILDSVSSAEKLMEFVVENESRLRDTWQVYFQAMIQQKARVYLYTDKLDAGTVRRTHFTPVEDINVLVRDLFRETGPSCRICVLPEGPQTIPYLI